MWSGYASPAVQLYVYFPFFLIIFPALNLSDIASVSAALAYCIASLHNCYPFQSCTDHLESFAKGKCSQKSLEEKKGKKMCLEL